MRPITRRSRMADQLSGAAAAIQERAVVARLALRDGVAQAINRVLDLTPRRRTNYRRLGETAASRRETQRRAAIAVLAFIGVTAVLGVGHVRLEPAPPGNAAVSTSPRARRAFADAKQKADRVFGTRRPASTTIRPRRTNLLQSAWAALEQGPDVGRASTRRRSTSSAPRVSTGLDELYGTVRGHAGPALRRPSLDASRPSGARARTTRRTSISGLGRRAYRPCHRRSGDDRPGGRRCRRRPRPRPACWRTAGPTC